MSKIGDSIVRREDQRFLTGKGRYTDDTVPPKQAVEFASTLKAASVDTTLVVLANVGHRPGLDLGTPGGQALIAFLDRVLGPGIRPDRGTLP